MPHALSPVFCKLSCAIGLAAVVGLSSLAMASDLADISMEVDGWTMVAITDVGLTTHIIATRDDDEALTTDIDVVLYEKTAVGWDGTAYNPSVTKEDALIDLATEFGLPDPQLGDWLIQFDQIDVLEYMVPRVPFGKGFFITDPLYVAASQLPDAQPLVEAAEQAGFAAGGSAVNTGSVSGGSDVGGPSSTDGCGCEDACVQNGFAALIDLYFSNPTIPIEDVVAQVKVAPGFGCPCYTRITVPGLASAWSSWVCGAWTTTLNSSTGICTYTTFSSRSKTRTMTTICTSCITGISTLTWTQFRSQSGSLSVRGGVDSNGVCPPPPTTCIAPAGLQTVGWFWTPPFGPGCPRP